MTKTVNDEVLEFMRAFIAGGVNQDFKPWANKLYQKLYRGSGEPPAPNFRDLLMEAEDYVREDQKELRQRIADALHANREVPHD